MFYYGSRIFQRQEKKVRLLPYDNDDAIKNVVWIPDVAKQAKSQDHEGHLQDKHTGENNVTDLQHISQLFRLQGQEEKGEEKNKVSKFLNRHFPHLVKTSWS